MATEHELTIEEAKPLSGLGLALEPLFLHFRRYETRVFLVLAGTTPKREGGSGLREGFLFLLIVHGVGQCAERNVSFKFDRAQREEGWKSKVVHAEDG